MRIRAGIIAFATVIQSIFFLTHFLIYKTWTFAPAVSEVSSSPWLKVIVGLLSVSFLTASLLAFRYSNPAVWLGIVSFLFFATVASWVVIGLTQLAGMDVSFHKIVEVLYAAAVLCGITGVLNAG